MLMPTFLDGSAITLPRRTPAVDRPRVLRRSRYRVLTWAVSVGLSIATTVLVASGRYARLQVFIALLWFTGCACAALQPRNRVLQPQLYSRHRFVPSDDDESLWTFELTNRGGSDAVVDAVAWTFARNGQERIVRDIPALFANLETPLSPYDRIERADPPHLHVSPGGTVTLLALPVRALAGVTSLQAHLEFTNFFDTRYEFDLAAELPEAPWSAISTEGTPTGGV